MVCLLDILACCRVEVSVHRCNGADAEIPKSRSSLHAGGSATAGVLQAVEGLLYRPVKFKLFSRAFESTATQPQNMIELSFTGTQEP